MGGECGTYGRQERCIQGFGGGGVREREYLEDLGLNRIILKWTLKKWDREAWTGFIWLGMGYRWRSLANAFLNSWVP